MSLGNNYAILLTNLRELVADEISQVLILKKIIKAPLSMSEFHIFVDKIIQRLRNKRIYTNLIDFPKRVLANIVVESKQQLQHIGNMRSSLSNLEYHIMRAVSVLPDIKRAASENSNTNLLIMQEVRDFIKFCTNRHGFYTNTGSGDDPRLALIFPPNCDEKTKRKTADSKENEYWKSWDGTHTKPLEENQKKNNQNKSGRKHTIPTKPLLKSDGKIIADKKSTPNDNGTKITIDHSTTEKTAASSNTNKNVAPKLSCELLFFRKVMSHRRQKKPCIKHSAEALRKPARDYCDIRPLGLHKKTRNGMKTAAGKTNHSENVAPKNDTKPKSNAADDPNFYKKRRYYFNLELFSRSMQLIASRSWHHTSSLRGLALDVPKCLEELSCGKYPSISDDSLHTPDIK